MEDALVPNETPHRHDGDERPKPNQEPPSPDEDVPSNRKLGSILEQSDYVKETSQDDNFSGEDVTLRVDTTPMTTHSDNNQTFTVAGSWSSNANTGVGNQSMTPPSNKLVISKKSSKGKQSKSPSLVSRSKKINKWKSAARTIMYVRSMSNASKSSDKSSKEHRYESNNVVVPGDKSATKVDNQIEMTAFRKRTASIGSRHSVTSTQNGTKRRALSSFIRSTTLQKHIKKNVHVQSQKEENNLLFPTNTSLPVKDVLKGIYRITRLKTAYGLILWTIFLGLYVSVFALMYDTHQAWEQQSALEDLFIDEEFPNANFKKNWNDIMNFEELWEWIEGPLMNGLYKDTWYNDQQIDSNDQGYLVDQTMKLVGGVRIRQHQVKKNSCNSRRFVKYIKKSRNQPERCEDPYTVCPFDRLDSSCLSEFRAKAPSWLLPLANVFNFDSTTFDYGEVYMPKFSPWFDKNYTLRDLPTRYSYRKMPSELKSGIPTTSGLFSYGQVGLYQDLPPTNRSEAERILKAMKNELWIDETTRGFGVTFTVYNTMTRMATTSRFTVEFLPSGRVLLRTKFRSFPVVLYGGSNFSLGRTVLEVFQALFFMYYIQKESRKNWRLGFRAYWISRKTTLLEVGVLAIFMVYLLLVYTFIYEITNGEAGQNFHVESKDYKDYFNLADLFHDARLTGGLGMAIACVKVIKYLSINKQALLLIKTISAAKNTLAMFALFFCTLWMGISWFAVMAYGSRVYQFHDLAGSMASVFRMMLGDYAPYDRLFEVEPIYTPWFFFFAEMFFIVIALNMLIAILVSQFESVHITAIKEEKWKGEVPTIYHDLKMYFSLKSYRCRKWCCCNKIAFAMSESVDQTRKIYAEDPIRYAEAYAETSEFWRRKLLLEFLENIRKIAHVGKDTATGPSVNLLGMLESLYIQWDIRSREAIESGAFVDLVDGRLPIACISANRILHMVCNPPPENPTGKDARPESEYMSKRNINRSPCPAFFARRLCIKGPCRNVTRNELDQTRRVKYTMADAIIKRTVTGYHELSDIVLIAPVISDADFWTNDEAIIGESLQLDIKDPKVMHAMFEVKVSLNGHAEKFHNIFLDVNTAQLYILTPFHDKFARTSSDMKLRTASSAGSMVMTESPLLSHRGLKKKMSNTIAHIEDVRIGDSQIDKKFKNGGRVRKIIDLLELQQVHVDRIDLHLLNMFFDDTIRSSYAFRFRTFDRRSNFLLLISQVSQSMRNGHGWSSEGQPMKDADYNASSGWSSQSSYTDSNTGNKIPSSSPASKQNMDEKVSQHLGSNEIMQNPSLKNVMKEKNSLHSKKSRRDLNKQASGTRREFKRQLSDRRNKPELGLGRANRSRRSTTKYISSTRNVLKHGQQNLPNLTRAPSLREQVEALNSRATDISGRKRSLHRQSVIFEEGFETQPYKAKMTKKERRRSRLLER